MSQAADNPDPAGDAGLADVGVPGIDGDPRALMPAPEPAQRAVGAAVRGGPSRPKPAATASAMRPRTVMRERPRLRAI